MSGFRLSDLARRVSGEVHGDADPEIEGICLKAMSSAPNERFATAMELAKAVEAWVKRVAPPTKVKLRRPGR